MVAVKLKGVHKVTAKGRTYFYAWRGGPRLPGEPGSPEFIEALAAAQGCDFHAPLRSSDTLEAARAAIRGVAPKLEEDRFFAPDIDAATALVRSGALVEAAGVALPRVCE